MAKGSMTIRDYSEELSNFGYDASVLTAGNIVAQTALHAALATATEGITIGVLAKQNLTQVLDESASIPALAYAQRELKALVTYQAVTSGKKFQIEIAAPLLVGTLVPGTDVFDLTSSEWDAWVTAFVAVAKSPDDIADSVIVLGARLVGRNI